MTGHLQNWTLVTLTSRGKAAGGQHSAARNRYNWQVGTKGPEPRDISGLCNTANLCEGREALTCCLLCVSIDWLPNGAIVHPPEGSQAPIFPYLEGGGSSLHFCSSVTSSSGMGEKWRSEVKSAHLVRAGSRPGWAEKAGPDL